MSLDAAPAIAANRFGLGARPGDLDHIRPDPRGWLSAQLSGPAPLLSGSELKRSAEVLQQGAELTRERRGLRAQNGAPSPEQIAALLRLPQLYRPIYQAEVGARMRNAVATQRPFVERLV